MRELSLPRWLYFFFFNDTATTEIYTLSLHDALPISRSANQKSLACRYRRMSSHTGAERSEEHTSELQSQSNLVCRLLLEKKKTVDYCRNDASDGELLVLRQGLFSTR